MKKISIPIVLLLTLLFLACNNENLESDEVLQSKDLNFRVFESTVNHNFAARVSYDEPCMTTNLIAGQNHIAGTVSVDVSYDNEDFPEGNLIITYNTNDDWTIGLTHLSLGECLVDIPTNGGGNPKVGKFEHTEPHFAGTNQVEYYVSLDALLIEGEEEYLEEYCFAAHAEVNGPTGEETAWAEGIGFDGNSWAMYVEAFLADCELDCQDPDLDTDGDGTPDCYDNCSNRYNTSQSDLDGDGIGDSCDYDVDGDGLPNDADPDMDGDGLPNDVDPDLDGDGYLDKVFDEATGTYLPLISYPKDDIENYDESVDNCPDTPNADQRDIDGDGVGDDCNEVR